MPNKITILYESPKHPISDRMLDELGKGGWQVHAQDLAALSFAKRYWLKFWNSVWLDLATSAFVTNFSDSVAGWFRRQLIRPHINAVLENLRKFQPPLVLVTSYTGGLVMSHLRNKQLYRGKVVFLLEGFDINPLWVLKNVDLYLCGSERQMELLKQRQVDSSKYVVVKPNIGKEYFENLTKEQAATEAGLLVTMPSVLLLVETDGADTLRESFLKMIRSATSFQVVIACREQSDIKAKLEKITSPVRHPVKFITNLDNLHLLLSAASVVVGPLSQVRLSQAAATKTPVIMTDTDLLENQENFRFLQEQSALAVGRIPAEVVFLVESMLEGRKVTNLNGAYELSAVPKNSLLLSDALSSVNPSSTGLKVQNYQKTK